MTAIIAANLVFEERIFGLFSCVANLGSAAGLPRRLSAGVVFTCGLPLQDDEFTKSLVD